MTTTQRIEKKKAPTLGVLDYLDIMLGRLSSRTSTDGARIRSWGVTFCILMNIPAFVLVLAFSASIIISAMSTRNHVPRKMVSAYMACVAKVKDVKQIKKCPQVKASSGARLTDKAFSFGSWPWVCVMFLSGLGFIAMIIRNKDDIHGLSEIAQTLSVFVTKELPIPQGVWGAFAAQAQKVTGISTDTLMKPDKIDVDTNKYPFAPTAPEPPPKDPSTGLSS